VSKKPVILLTPLKVNEYKVIMRLGKGYLLVINVCLVPALSMDRVARIIRSPDDDTKCRAGSTGHHKLLDMPYSGSFTVMNELVAGACIRSQVDNYAAAFLVDSSTVTTSTPLEPKVSLSFLRRKGDSPNPPTSSKCYSGRLANTITLALMACSLPLLSFH
jgi:hypothetical protein